MKVEFSTSPVTVQVAVWAAHIAIKRNPYYQNWIREEIPGSGSVWVYQTVGGSRYRLDAEFGVIGFEGSRRSFLNGCAWGVFESEDVLVIDLGDGKSIRREVSMLKWDSSLPTQPSPFEKDWESIIDLMQPASIGEKIEAKLLGLRLS